MTTDPDDVVLLHRFAVDDTALSDHEPHLRAFYADCGFQPTDAGLIRLAVSDAVP